MVVVSCHCDLLTVSSFNLPFHLGACICSCHLFIFGLFATLAGHFFSLLLFSFLEPFFSQHFPSSSTFFPWYFFLICFCLFSLLHLLPPFPFVFFPPFYPFFLSNLPSLFSTTFPSLQPFCCPTPITRQHWDKGGGDPEEPEWLAAGAWLPARPQPPVLTTPAGPQPQPSDGVDLSQCGLFPLQTPLQLSGREQLSASAADWKHSAHPMFRRKGGKLHTDSWGCFWNCATVLWVCMKFMHTETIQHVHTVHHCPTLTKGLRQLMPHLLRAEPCPLLLFLDLFMDGFSLQFREIPHGWSRK